MQEPIKDWTDYVSALRRRRTTILAVSSVFFVLSVLVAMLWPPVYRSAATILIEEQEIPPDLIRSTITTYAWQRIQTISQRVMTRQNLLSIVDKYNLYPGKRQRETSEEIVERMRNDIKLDAISADVIDPRSGRPMPATIAFTLSYDGESAAVTQQVANELTTLYLNENLKSRTEKATETFNFLTDEATKLSEHIAELEDKLAKFKEKNVDRLPELNQLNLQLMDRTERDLMDTQNQIRSLEERKIYLEGQLAQLNPNSPMFSSTGERILDSASRLKMLKTDLAAAQARYAPDHPDVLRLKREIEGLEKQSGAVSQAQEQAREMTRLRTELAEARKKYSEDHPDVARLTRQLAAMEVSLRETPSPETAVAAEKPDNPAFLSLQAQLEGVKSDLRANFKKRDELRGKIVSYEKRISQTPQVEREYLELRRDYENSQLKYREIKAKQMEAQVGQEMEKERKGERFTLIDPPQLPEEPVKPRRLVIVILGFLMSLGGGVGFVLVAETLDRSVRSPRAVAALLGGAPLSVIPYVENSEDVARREKTKKLMFRSTVAGFVVAVVIVQFFWIPWDVLWFKGLRKLGGG